AQGDLAMMQGDADAAAERYRAALAANPRSVSAIVNLGILAARSGNMPVAEARFREAYAIDPIDPQVRQNLARIELHHGHVAQAAEMYEELLTDFPDHVPALLALGWIRASSPHDNVRDAQRARTVAEKVLT